MLGLLNIAALRPGASGNPAAPNAANSDEAKVGAYTLPDPLRFKDGAKVTGPGQWSRRRAELLEEFDIGTARRVSG